MLLVAAVSVVTAVTGVFSASASPGLRQNQTDKPAAGSSTQTDKPKAEPSTQSDKPTAVAPQDKSPDSLAKSTSPAQQSPKSEQAKPAESAKPQAGKRSARGKVIVPRSKTATDPEVREKLSKARTDLVSATQAYKASLANLLPFQESAVKTASDQVQLRQSLFDKGIVSRKELEDSKHSLAEAQTKLDETKRQLSESDSMLAEIEDDQYLKAPAAPGEYRAIGAVIRYNGATQWSLKDASKVENFYQSEFGQQLPISAFGQTAVHDRLGFDHHDAMDVA
ncbi:MAG: hypothetical protein ACREDR_06785, partial [Blastocatellia bacterium]